MVRKTESAIGILIIFCLLISLGFVSAFIIQSVSPSYINRSVPTIINFTINNSDDFNITQIVFTLPMEARYYGGNQTDAGNAISSNSTAGPKITITYENLTTGIIGVNQTKSFWFNATLRNIGTFFTNITLVASHLSGGPTRNSYNYPLNFAFSGFVKNGTGGNESNVNISIYRVSEGNGPPVETLESNILSVNGSFSFPSINGSASFYKLKMIRYGADEGCVSGNSTCNATKIGPSLPSFPAIMYYPTTADLAEAMFMRPPSLNGTTFYLNPATTLRLYAHNNSNAQKFGYEVVDQKVGFPTESNVKTSVFTKDIVIPIGRNYTVMFSRFPRSTGFGFTFSPLCDGSFMNDSTCPTPPISNSSLGTLTAGQILTINQSLVTSNYRLTGCINTGGNNNSDINITTISLKMVPWTGFVPPTRGDMGDINLNSDINYTGKGGCNFAYYNISVMGATGGINYMLEIYAKNASNETGNPGDANNLAVFQNISIMGNTNQNLTLYKLSGGYYSSGTSVNTTQIKINVLNSTGGAIINKMNGNLKVKNSVLWGSQTMSYIIESMSSGSFYISVLNNSDWAKIMIFANDAPPKQITLNLSKSETNITLVTMTDGNGVGMKRINESGGMEMINTSANTRPMNINFLRNTGTWGSDCNVLSPDSSCSLTSMSAQNFNPLSAMVAGKVNMEMKMTATNVTMTFINFDMFAAKQPPMDSIISDHASGNTTANQAWQFGSFAPSDTYDYVIISMPYSDSIVDDSAQINLSAPLFYDENWNIIWNSSRGDTSANLTDDFVDYNNSNSGLYRGFLSSGGINCSKTDSYLNVTPCYINTTLNMIYMRVPHFSGLGPNVIGSAISSTSGSSSSSGNGGSGAGQAYWRKTVTLTEEELKEGYTKELAIKQRLKIKINNESHYVGVVELNSTTAKINVSSTPQQATLSIGDLRKFNVIENVYYDISVKLNSISDNKANITIKSIREKIVEEDEKEKFTEAVKKKEKENRGKNSIGILSMSGLAIFIIILVCYWLYKNRKNKKGRSMKVNKKVKRAMCFIFGII